MKQRVFLGCVAVATLAAGLGVTACGGSTSGQGAAATASAAPTATAGGEIAGIPFYQPSHVVSHTGHSALLTTPASVTKVTDYYVKEVHSGGWTTVSKSATRYNGNLTVKKSGQGATISVSPSRPGSRVSISTYPAH